MIGLHPSRREARVVIGINFPVEALEELANRLVTEQSKLESQLAALRATCQRDPSFSGSAADRYDEYLAQWDRGAATLLGGLEGASRILQQLASHLRQTDSALAQGFDL
jgi:uncharacterized protein YukE